MHFCLDILELARNIVIFIRRRDVQAVTSSLSSLKCALAFTLVVYFGSCVESGLNFWVKFFPVTTHKQIKRKFEIFYITPIHSCSAK